MTAASMATEVRNARKCRIGILPECGLATAVPGSACTGFERRVEGVQARATRDEADDRIRRAAARDDRRPHRRTRGRRRRATARAGRGSVVLAGAVADLRARAWPAHSELAPALARDRPFARRRRRRGPERACGAQ